MSTLVAGFGGAVILVVVATALGRAVAIARTDLAALLLMFIVLWTWFLIGVPRGVTLRRHSGSVKRERSSDLRVLWQILRDFDSGGWAARDLSALRIVSLNVNPDRPLGAALAQRLERSVQKVYETGLDRLDDVILMVHRLGIDAALAERLERASLGLTKELGVKRPQAGEALTFDADAVVEAVDEVFKATDSLRRRVQPRLVAEVGTVFERLAHGRLGAFVSRGQLAFEEPERRILVDVRARDLANAIARVIEVAFEDGGRDLAVDVSADSNESEIEIRFAHRVAGPRLRLARLATPLRELNAYGCSFAIEDGTLHRGTVLRLELPRNDSRRDAEVVEFAFDRKEIG